MIISRKMAEAAAGELGLTLHETLDEATISMAYRALARETHPDAGGTLEAFAAVDRAKHVLLGWLKRPEEERSVFELRRCEPCGGTGSRRIQRGFGSINVQCGACRGSGDADYDIDSSNEGVH